jgi:hypothetical protein
MSCQCERCEATVGVGYDESNNEVRLQEMAMSFGILTLLCYYCRKDWAVFTYAHDLFRKYSKTGFEFKMWQYKYRRNPFKCDMGDGLQLLDALDALEVELHKVTRNWIKAGLSKAEREARPDPSERDDYRADS